jgi:WD40 repeat protein
VVTEPLRGHLDLVHSIAFSPDGRHIVSGSRDGTIQIWDAVTGQPVRKLRKAHEGTHGVHSVAFSPNGKRVVSGGDDNLVKIWYDPVPMIIKGGRATLLSKRLQAADPDE